MTTTHTQQRSPIAGASHTTQREFDAEHAIAAAGRAQESGDRATARIRLNEALSVLDDLDRLDAEAGGQRTGHLGINMANDLDDHQDPYISEGVMDRVKALSAQEHQSRTTDS